MIVEALLNVVFGLVNLLLSVFSLIPIPDMPEGIVEVGQTVLGYLLGGLDVLKWFLSWPLVIAGLTITLVAHNADHLYSLIRWILRKFGIQ